MPAYSSYIFVGFELLAIRMPGAGISWPVVFLATPSGGYADKFGLVVKSLKIEGSVSFSFALAGLAFSMIR